MNKLFTINMDKAKDVHRDTLRRERVEYLEELDTAYMRALEENNEVEMKRIVLVKKRLRDLPKHPNIKAAKTIEDLKLLTVESVLT